MNFTVNGTHIPDRCNTCLESDHTQCEATRAATISDALSSTLTLKDLCSELEAQKEKEHLTHSISFNSERVFDIQQSISGNNVLQLDPVTENGKNRLKSQADALAERFWQLLGYCWQ